MPSRRNVEREFSRRSFLFKNSVIGNLPERQDGIEQGPLSMLPGPENRKAVLGVRFPRYARLAGRSNRPRRDG
jgi:hypothetical protein